MHFHAVETGPLQTLIVFQCYECQVFHLLLRGRALCLLVCVKLFTLFAVNEYLTPVLILALINI